MRGLLPFTFEDRTAGLSNTDFDDIYDRRFFHVRHAPGTDSTTEIFEMHFPASRHRGVLPSDTEPIIQLHFLPGNHLGTISLLKSTFQMSEYLRKASFFGRSLSRTFIASDGQEYRWDYQSNPGQEWTCTTTKDDCLVAHYDLHPSDVRYLRGSGSSLVVDEGFADIAPEPYVQSGEPLNEFLKSFWQRQVDAAEQETPDYKHPPLPLARIKKVMKSDPDVKMIAADAPILFCKACEMFIAEVTARAFIVADSNKRRTLSRADIAKGLSKSDQFDFLIDIVPREDGIGAKRVDTK